MSMMRRLCEFIAGRLGPHREIYDREGEKVYLARYYLVGKRGDPEKAAQDRARWEDQVAPLETRKLSRKMPANPFLHHFQQSDDAIYLHSHPWKWSFSIVLAGGYSEERRVGNMVVRRDVRPFRINILRETDYHRVDLYEKDAWTLFVAGPKTSNSEWYFWDRDTGLRMQWERFIAWRRGRAPSAWETTP